MLGHHPRDVTEDTDAECLASTRRLIDLTPATQGPCWPPRCVGGEGTWK